MLKCLVLVLLCVALVGAEDISCLTTNIPQSTTDYGMPNVAVVMRVPGTWTVVGPFDAESPFFYRTAFRFYNASNSVQLFPRDTQIVPSAALGVTTIKWEFFYPTFLVGTVKLKYTQLAHQRVRFSFNSTAVTSLDLTCSPDKLNSIYSGTIASGYVTIQAAKPIKRCDSNSTSFLDASWFSYSTHVCGSAVPGCTYFGRGSPCAAGTGFIPLDSQRMVWYCPASTNFSTALTSVSYTLTDGYVCDAADNHTVRHYGATSGDSRKLVLQYGVVPDDLVGYLIPSTSETHNNIIVDTYFPVVYANFTANKKTATVTHSTATSVERCTPYRALSNVLIEYQCPVEFKPWGATTPVWHLIGPAFHYRFANSYSVEASYSIDDELDNGLNAVVVNPYRIKEAYRLSAYTLLVRLSHVSFSLADPDNFIVHESALYNVSNVTRATASSYYLNFNEVNKLPDSSNLYVYFFPHDNIINSNLHLMSDAIKITNGAPDDDEDITYSDLSAGWKEGAYIGLACAGLVGLYILNWAYQYWNGGSKGYTRVRK